MGNDVSLPSDKLVDAMVSGHVGDQVLILEKLEKMTRDNEKACKSFVVDEGAKVANELMRSLHVNVSSTMIKVLINVAKQDTLRQQLYDEVDLEAMVSQLALSGLPYQQEALRCIQVLCRQEIKGSQQRVIEVCRILIKRRIIELLLDATIAQDQDTAVAAVSSLANIAHGADIRVHLIEAAVVPRFFMWADTKNEKMKREATRGIKNAMQIFMGANELNFLSSNDVDWISQQTGFQFPKTAKKSVNQGLNMTRLNRLSPNGMLAELTKSVQGHISCDRTVIALLDPVTNESLWTVEMVEENGKEMVKVIPVVQKNRDNEDSEKLEELLSKPKEELTSDEKAELRDLQKSGDFPGLIGEVFSTMRAFRINDAITNPTYNKTGIDTNVGIRSKSVMAAPIMSKNVVIGALLCFNKRNTDVGDAGAGASEPKFGPEDEAKAVSYCTFTSKFAELIMGKKDALDQASKKNVRWEDPVMATIVGFDLRTVLRVIMGRVSTMLNMDRSCFYVAVPERQLLWACIPDEKIGDFQMPITVGMAGLCVKEKKPIVTNDCWSHPAFNPDMDRKTGYRTNSMMCVPIMDGDGEVLGVCQLINKKRGMISTIDLQRTSKFLVEFARLIQNGLPDLRAELAEKVASKAEVDKIQAELAKFDGRMDYTLAPEERKKKAELLKQKNKLQNSLAIKSLMLLRNCIVTGDQQVQENALASLSHICRHAPNHAFFMDEPEVINILIKVASPPGSMLHHQYTMPMRCDALRALANIVSNPDYEERVADQDYLSVFMSAIYHPDHTIIFQGLRGLANLAQVSYTHKTLLKSNSLKSLLSFVIIRSKKKVRKKAEQEQGQTAGSQIVTKEEKERLEAEAAAKKREHDHRVDCAQQVARVMSGLAREKQNIQVLINAGVLRKMKGLLLSEDPDILPAALTTLKLMVQHPEPRHMFMEDTGVRHVVEKILEGRVGGTQLDRTTNRSMNEIGQLFTLLLEHPKLQDPFRQKYTFKKLQFLYQCPNPLVKTTYAEAILEILKNPDEKKKVQFTSDLVDSCDLMANIKNLLSLPKPPQNTNVAEDEDLDTAMDHHHSLHNLQLIQADPKMDEMLIAVSRIIEEYAKADKDQRFRITLTEKIPTNMAPVLLHESEYVVTELLSAFLALMEKGTRDVTPTYLAITQAIAHTFPHVLSFTSKFSEGQLAAMNREQLQVEVRAVHSGGLSETEMQGMHTVKLRMELLRAAHQGEYTEREMREFTAEELRAQLRLKRLRKEKELVDENLIKSMTDNALRVELSKRTPLLLKCCRIIILLCSNPDCREFISRTKTARHLMSLGHTKVAAQVKVAAKAALSALNTDHDGLPTEAKPG